MLWTEAHVPDGDSILIAVPTRATPDDKRGQVLLLVTPRIVFDGRQARAD